MVSMLQLITHQSWTPQTSYHLVQSPQQLWETGTALALLWALQCHEGENPDTTQLKSLPKIHTRSDCDRSNRGPESMHWSRGRQTHSVENQMVSLGFADHANPVTTQCHCHSTQGAMRSHNGGGWPLQMGPANCGSAPGHLPRTQSTTQEKKDKNLPSFPLNLSWSYLL